jgi:hypothetical protein
LGSIFPELAGSQLHRFRLLFWSWAEQCAAVRQSLLDQSSDRFGARRRNFLSGDPNIKLLQKPLLNADADEFTLASRR